MASASKGQIRIMLWAPPRSLSTAFERCISCLNSDTMKVDVTHELYTAACHLGPNRQIKIPRLFEPVVYEPKLSYKKVKKRLEAEKTGKDLVFCKELAYSVAGKFDMIPDGYKHTFLIRHPAKVFLSFQTFLEKFPNKLLKLDLREDILPEGLVYKEMYDLMQYTIHKLGQKPIVIDADDLVENPEEVLKLYCKATGVPYQEPMTTWRKVKYDLKEWSYSKRLMFVNKVMGQYDRAFSTSELVKSSRTDIDINCLPKKIRELVDIALPYYEQMYECRLRLDTTDNTPSTPDTVSNSSSMSVGLSSSSSSPSPSPSSSDCESAES
ncbi:uncharacterized protein LOC578741 [Strongylocentrotus purpuratus]|uniref:Uncharacterized protein n=1 Tax=Strongylocentrotus purpuratus TaxID=7668 RepID=A0A7M7RAL3_STRPU|nr:uncharacterized protein LOC578741 [Strongylocentrotus purpuratus]|eukprot:XP_783988.1 PREDICTED: uncharacterized protein LOC578741 [Strongylocentrotus purpuratus]